MILVDWKALCFVNFSAMGFDTTTPLQLKRRIYKKATEFQSAFEKEHGSLVFCLDNRSWRYKPFPLYKWKRQEDQKKSKVDWEYINLVVSEIQEEFEQNLPYRFVQANHAEADDVIGTLVRQSKQKHVIVSRDKDFHQFVDNKRVWQYDHVEKGFVKVQDKEYALFELICRGDSSDGIPNILSPIDTFKKKERQKSLKSKLIEDLFEHREDLSTFLKNVENGSTILKRFQQNRTLIDLSRTPKSVQKAIVGSYKRQNPQEKMPNLSKYLKEHKITGTEF